METMKTIQNYDEIIIDKKTFVMMDIDDTIIKFETLHKNWWKENQPNAIEKWLKIIQEETPSILDELEFSKLLDRIKLTDSEIIFITARNEKLRDLTYEHLINCGLNIDREQIYHSYPKGKTLLEICEKNDFDNMIFVDDHLDNIEDVQKYLKKYSVQYYKMEHKNLK